MSSAATQNTVVNGVSLDALQKLVESVKADARNGLAGFHARTRWTGGTKSESTTDSWTIGAESKPRGYTIRTDEPPELCGGNTAANPQEVLMSAVNACMMVGYVALAAIEGITLESLEIETTGELDLRGFLGLDPTVNPGYDTLQCTVRIKGDGTPEQFRRIHQLVQATSPNYANITRAIRFYPELVVG
ncbi:MAG: OsmC family peroxiredoxin [Phycisphaeraceae bacterium]|nr:MAG: OsmC family peroxiredoxin [Phycisphaeraceae bacterium]